MHNFEKKIAKLMEEKKLSPQKGKMYDYAALHDNWCKIYNGGECNCDPEIVATEITSTNKAQVAERIDRDTKEFMDEIKKKMV